MHIAVLDNGIGYIGQVFSSENYPDHTFSVIPALELGSNDLGDVDMFIAPNGTDHVALFRNREKIRALLDSGGSLLCCCGWTTDWIPGNRWEMQTNIPLRTYEVSLPNPEHPILSGARSEELNISNGKRGFWACGHIEASPDAVPLMVNNLNEPIMIVDEGTTRGTIIATASGPLPAFGEGTTADDGDPRHSFDIIFENILDYCAARTERQAAPAA